MKMQEYAIDAMKNGPIFGLKNPKLFFFQTPLSKIDDSIKLNTFMKKMSMMAIVKPQAMYFIAAKLLSLSTT
jgi:hypothetical protein